MLARGNLEERKERKGLMQPLARLSKECGYIVGGRDYYHILALVFGTIYLGRLCGVIL